MSAERQFSFAGYRLDLGQRMLFRGAEPVPLTPRAFDLLVLLVSHAGQVVSKDEILKHVWGQTVVEEGTITWHLHSLRQSLANGDGSARFIDTLPKRGYRFVAPLTAATDRRRAVESVPPAAPVPDAHAPDKRRNAWWIAAGVVAIFVAALIAWRTRLEPTLPYAKRDWLLISNFENQTGEPRFDSALLTALTVSLEQSTYVNVFPRSRVETTLERMRRPADATVDEPLAREICLREGLRALVTPSITRTGKEYAVAARLTDPRSGNTVRAYLIRASDESRILVALQELAGSLRRDLGESIQDIDANNRPLEQVTTPVLAALQHYTAGMQQWSRSRYDEATREFEAAIDEDAEFAMAYAALGKGKYSSVYNRPDLGNEYFQRALALSERTTSRERQLIAADFAASRGQVAEARSLYVTYAAAYPDDLRMHAKMGDLLMGAALYQAAIEAFSSALEVDPADNKSRFNLGIAYASKGNFAEGRRQMELAIARDPAMIRSGTMGATYGWVLFGSGDRAAAEKYFRDQLAEPPRVHRAERALGLIDTYDGKYASAAVHFRAAADAPNNSTDTNLSRARNLGYLASALEARGDRKGALRALDLGVASLDTHGPSPIEFRARFANAYSRLGNLDAAARQLEKVIAGADALKPRDHATVQYARAEFDLASGHAARAQELFRNAVRADAGVELPLVLSGLARASAANGDRGQAIEAYQQLIAQPGAWFSWEAQEFWLMAHLELARLCRAQGDDEQAAAALDPLLALWAHADADLPAVVAARALRARLAGPKVAAATT